MDGSTTVLFVIIISQFCMKHTASQGLLNATDYKWTDVVLDQLPVISKACLQEVEKCYGVSVNFENLLFYDDKERLRLCDETNGQCLEKKMKWDVPVCIPLARHRVKNFFCFKYNISDNDTPPITTSCAKRYWLCSKMQVMFYDNIYPAQRKKEFCEKGIAHDCFPWYFRAYSFYRYQWERALAIEERTCVSNETKIYNENDIYDLRYVLACYGKYFNLFKLMTEYKSFNEQKYLCGNIIECLMAGASVKEWNCGLHEARAAHEFMCSGTHFTPDKYGLFLVNEECKNSFSSCYNYTLQELIDDPELKKTVCRTREHYLEDCLDSSHCNMYQDIEILGNFLCFDLGDPVLLVHDGCVERYRQCYFRRNIKEGFSHLEMNKNVHMKSEFCEFTEGVRECLIYDMDHYERGCTRNELKIIHDFLCGSCFYVDSCKAKRNYKNEVLLETSDGANLTQYKWLPLLQSQLPSLSKSCMKMFHHCFDITFEQLMFHYDEKRRKMCTDREGKKCLGQPVSGSKPYCSRLEIFRIQMFLCYKYNATDSVTPPVSIPCVMRYWECSKIWVPFLQRIPVAHREIMCNNELVFEDCTRCMWADRFREHSSDVLEFMCYTNMTQTRRAISRAAVRCMQECYGMNFDIFEILQNMKYLEDQNYMCGHLEECLVSSEKPGTINDYLVCNSYEAKAVDEFMCSGTAFVPDRYGFFLTSDQCLESFNNDCYNKTNTISNLFAHPTNREDLCRTRQGSLDKCLDKSFCTKEPDVKILGNFLCFNESDQILKVTDFCIRRFKLCFEISSDEGFSYLYMSDNLYIINRVCGDDDMRKCLISEDSEEPERCNMREIDIIKQQLCSSCNRIRVVTGFWAGFVFSIVGFGADYTGSLIV